MHKYILLLFASLLFTPASYTAKRYGSYRTDIGPVLSTLAFRIATFNKWSIPERRATVVYQACVRVSDAIIMTFSG